MRYAVIIAGGSGKRLWPKSRNQFPKFFIKVKGKNTLLQDAVSRARGFIPNENIIVITNKRHLKLVREQLKHLPRKNIIAEPVSRNTAPAICMAASFIKKKDPNGIIFVMPADHIIEDPIATKEIFGLASLIAGMKESIVTLGIKPTYPACGFGYIKAGRIYKNLVSNRRCSVYKVDKFVEKPGLKKAEHFLRSKRYFWNSGIFIARAEVFTNEFKAYSPRIYKIAEKISKAIGTKSEHGIISRYYGEFPDISIDYAVMEKTKKAYLLRSDISWKDIGSWKSIDEYLDKDAKGNAIRARFIGIDVANSIIMGEKKHLIGAVGIKDMVIIQTDDATLVCPKNRAGDVKRLVDAVGKKGLTKYI